MLFVLIFDLYRQEHSYVQDHEEISIQKNSVHIDDVLMNKVILQRLFYDHENVNILNKFQYLAMKMNDYHS